MQGRKCSRSSYTLWVVVTCHFSSWSYRWPREEAGEESGQREGEAGEGEIVGGDDRDRENSKESH